MNYDTGYPPTTTSFFDGPPPYHRIISKNRNIVKDFNMLQGFESAMDYIPRRDINCRYCSIENASLNPIACAITLYEVGPIPPPAFYLKGGEVKAVGLNPPDEEAQFLWLMDWRNKKPVSDPQILNVQANQVIIREGDNMWTVNLYRQATFVAPR